MKKQAEAKAEPQARRRRLDQLVRLLHVHWWRIHHSDGANVYTQCRCGQRSHFSIPGGYSPLDIEWLEDEPNPTVDPRPTGIGEKP